MNTIEMVLDVYRKSKNVKNTAAICEISDAKVRKILYSQGVLESPLSKKILEYHRRGYSPQAIADLLHISVKAVNSYLPYKRGLYGESQTKNAEYQQEWRRTREKKDKKAMTDCEKTIRSMNVREKTRALERGELLIRCLDKGAQEFCNAKNLKIYGFLDGRLILQGCIEGEFRDANELEARLLEMRKSEERQEQ